MKRKLFRPRALSMMLIGMAVLLAASAGEAGPISITAISVNVNGTLFNVWAYPIALPATGNTAVLAQTVGYNFDTSDLCITVSCAGVQPIITITTNLGVMTFRDNTDLLGVPVADHVVDPPRETRDYVLTQQLTGVLNELTVEVGYTDNAHLQATHPACAPNPNEAIGAVDCFPNTGPLSAQATPGDLRLQAVAASVGGGCLGSADPCFDSGVLRITNIEQVAKVPEPSTLLLLGAGLVGLAAWGRKRLQS